MPKVQFTQLASPPVSQGVPAWALVSPLLIRGSPAQRERAPESCSQTSASTRHAHAPDLLASFEASLIGLVIAPYGAGLYKDELCFLDVGASAGVETRQ